MANYFGLDEFLHKGTIAQKNLDLILSGLVIEVKGCSSECYNPCDGCDGNDKNTRPATPKEVREFIEFYFRPDPEKPDSFAFQMKNCNVMRMSVDV